jgi:hypothetical protein
MKTGRELLESLPPDIRLAWAKEAIREQGRRHTEFLLNYEFVNFEMFILGSFSWADSKQGHHFWYKISQL